MSSPPRTAAITAKPAATRHMVSGYPALVLAATPHVDGAHDPRDRGGSEALARVELQAPAPRVRPEGEQPPRPGPRDAAARAACQPEAHRARDDAARAQVVHVDRQPRPPEAEDRETHLQRRGVAARGRELGDEAADAEAGGGLVLPVGDRE